MLSPEYVKACDAHMRSARRFRIAEDRHTERTLSHKEFIKRFKAHELAVKDYAAAFEKELTRTER